MKPESQARHVLSARQLIQLLGQMIGTEMQWVALLMNPVGHVSKHELL